MWFNSLIIIESFEIWYKIEEIVTEWIKFVLVIKSRYTEAYHMPSNDSFNLFDSNWM